MTEKMVSQSILELNNKNILQLIADNVYKLVGYTDEEIGNMVELSPEQIAELSAVINDKVIAKNKTFSSTHINDLLQEVSIDANKYADELVANLSNIELDIVEVLPDASSVNKSTIYILKDSTGGTNNTLNVWSDTTYGFVEVGKLDVNMDSYYTKLDIDTLLADKANADEVVSPDDVVQDLTTTSGTTVLSTFGLQKELGKKIGKSDISTTINEASTNDTVPTNKTVYDNCVRVKNLEYSYTDTLTTLEEVILSILNNTNPHQFKPGVYSGTISSTHTGGGDLGSWRGNYILTVSHNGMYGTSGIINTQGKSFSIQYEKNKWIIDRLCATKVADVPWTEITTFTSAVNSGSVKYRVSNGVFKMIGRIRITSPEDVNSTTLLFEMPSIITLANGLGLCKMTAMGGTLITRVDYNRNVGIPYIVELTTGEKVSVTDQWLDIDFMTVL